VYEQLLVPLDGSRFAEAALDKAVELAARLKSKVILFNAITPLDRIIGETLPWGSLDPEADQVPVGVARERFEAEKRRAQAYFDTLKDKYRTRGVEMETHLEEGDAAEAILRFADSSGVSLIVMSTHGRGGLARLRFGSVADAVVRNSRTPVLLVRSVAEQTAA
jgi:nucleotide-binding universal stress UspA family protein